MENVDYSLYILNEKNKYISKNVIQKLLSVYDIVGYRIRELATFQHAMTHTSYLKRDFKTDKIVKMIKEKNLEPIGDAGMAIPLQDESYERLEYLGDSIIHAILAEYLFGRYPDKDEGFLTKLRTKIENGQTLAKLAKDLGLHEYVLIARNIEQIGGREKNSHIFEDTFEAFLGALYVDSGGDYGLCKKLVVNIVETHLDLAELIYTETNHKDTLLQYYHKMKWADPEYKLLEVQDRNSKKYFNMGVSNPYGQIAGMGVASSKKKAEQKAAYNALVYFNIIGDEESADEEIYEV
ncbi:MAG: ribonuclease III [Hyperionvirus sp.]|uniref:Ribonuclease III n=1 Tax=Hyperionvirus sp. TaxID=2487770 RepID=A0A3G5AAI5_9VIRU|nr:MAG: ribonuclease III [Hyperionvirus sp.]